MKHGSWRKLTFDGERYAWRRIHEHHVLPADAPGEGRCREVLVARLFPRGGRSLRIEFTDGVDRNAGYPEAGVVWLSAPSPGVAGPSANLNLPRMARAAIEVAIARGWDPRRARHVTILDGWSLLDELIARYERLGEIGRRSS
jgi:hypothetical protein